MGSRGFNWPWDRSDPLDQVTNYYPNTIGHSRCRLDNLIKAGAMIAAEIDRHMKATNHAYS